MSSTYSFLSTIFHNTQKSELVFNICADFLKMERYCFMLLSCGCHKISPFLTTFSFFGKTKWD